MWRIVLLSAALAASGCASNSGAKSEVAAVVQDETSRQAAGIALQRGEDSKDALKAAADATDKSKGEARPPS